MQIKKSELLKKYGIDLTFGKYQIYVKKDGYEIYTVKDDTEGCLLCGKKFDNYVIDSRKTFKELMQKLKDQKDIEIEIKLAKNGQ